jgi:hypothetical protein
MLRPAKFLTTVAMLLGITSTIGALSHGTDPTKSVCLALGAFALLVALNEQQT